MTCVGKRGRSQVAQCGNEGLIVRAPVDVIRVAAGIEGLQSLFGGDGLLRAIGEDNELISVQNGGDAPIREEDSGLTRIGNELVGEERRLRIFNEVEIVSLRGEEASVG